MSGIVTRKFTADSRHIYFINNGIISRKKITDFIRESPNAYHQLSTTGSNVGWCTEATYLMFTENDEIFRVPVSRVVELLLNDKTLEVPCEEDAVFAVKYYKDICPDETFIKERDYKDFDKYLNRQRFIGYVPEECDNVRYRKCIISQDPTHIYSVSNGRVYKENIIDYIAVHGVMWKRKLKESSKDVGFTCFHPRDFLMIRQDEIRLLSHVEGMKIIRNWSTKVNERESSYNDYLIMDVFANVYNAKLSKSTVDYKNDICV